MRLERLKVAFLSTLIIALLTSTLLIISAKAAWGQEIGWTRQFGSSGWEYAYGVAVDTFGNVYVAGYTEGALPGQTPSGDWDAFVRKYDGSGSELWTKQFGSSANDYAYGVAVDTFGNVYVAGYTWGALPGQTPSGGWDAFVRKYDGSGSELWTRQFGSSVSDIAHAVAVDTSDNVYVAGYTWGALPGQTPSGNVDAFVRKYDGSGSELWTRQFGSSDWDEALDIAFDTSGNIYAAGRTGGALPGQTTSGGYDAFVRKYDGSGSELWTKQFGSSANDIAYGVAVDTFGNVYVAGYTEGALPGQTPSGVRDAFVREYDSSGSELWTRQFGSSDWDEALDVAFDTSGNVYVAGETSGALPGQTSSGDLDAFVRKYDGSGSELWTKQFGSFTSDIACAVAVDASGSVYIAGSTYGALPGQTSSGGWDAFLVKFVHVGVEFKLETIYKISLNVDRYLNNGSKLVMKFYTYADAYQGENVVWSGATPDNVSFSKIVPHPENKAVEKVRLDLTYENTENIISTIAGFVVGKVMLEGRYSEIPSEWSLASPEEKVELEVEFGEMPLQWALAPS